MSLLLLSAYQASSAMLSCSGKEKQHQRLQGFGPSGEDAADSRRPVLLGDSVTVGAAILNDQIDWEASRFVARSAVVGMSAASFAWPMCAAIEVKVQKMTKTRKCASQ